MLSERLEFVMVKTRGLADSWCFGTRVKTHVEYYETTPVNFVNENFPFWLHTNGKLNADFWRQESSDLV
jgi:hypothetical protein